MLIRRNELYAAHGSEKMFMPLPPLRIALPPSALHAELKELVPEPFTELVGIAYVSFANPLMSAPNEFVPESTASGNPLRAVKMPEVYQPPSSRFTALFPLSLCPCLAGT